MLLYIMNLHANILIYTPFSYIILQSVKWQELCTKTYYKQILKGILLSLLDNLIFLLISQVIYILY